MRKKIAAAAIVVLGLFFAVVAIAEEMPAKYKSLERLQDTGSPIDLVFKEQPLRRIFQALGRVADVDIAFGDGFPSSKKFSIESHGASLKVTLVQLADANDLVYEVTDSRSFVVKGAAAKP